MNYKGIAMRGMKFMMVTHSTTHGISDVGIGEGMEFLMVRGQNETVKNRRF